MRRIYESSALHRDDEEAHAPRERDEETRPQAMRSVPSGFLSRLVVPHWLRYRATSISVSTPDRAFAPTERIPFTVTIRNGLPIPITLTVDSPIPWTWSIDGHPEASHVPRTDVPDEQRGFHLERGERKQFHKRWSGSFKVGAREWEPAEPGEHTISVRLNVEDAAGKGLTDETTIEIVDDAGTD